MAAAAIETGRLKAKHEFEIWQLAKVSNYDLVWRLLPHSISTAVFHSGTARCVNLLQYSFDVSIDVAELPELLESIVKKHDWLQASSYNSVKLVWGFGGCTLVPGPLFEPDKLTGFADLSLGQTKRGWHPDFYRHASGAVSVFNVHDQTLDYLQTQFRASRVKQLHSNAVIAQQLQDMGAIGGQTKCAVLLDKQFITVVITSGKDWLLVNRYNIRTPEEITYFVLLAIKETGLDAKTLPISLFGDTYSNPEWFAHLKQYAGICGEGNLPAAWGAHNATEGQLAPWFAIFAATSCV